MVEEPTMPVPVMAGKVSKVGSIPSITMSLKAIPTLLMPAIPPELKQAQAVANEPKVTRPLARCNHSYCLYCQHCRLHILFPATPDTPLW